MTTFAASGFGDRSGIELPSETRGLLRTPKQVGSDIHSVHCDRARSRRDAGAAGQHGVGDCEWRRVYAAAHFAAVHRRDEGRCAFEAGGVSSGSNQLPATLPDGAHRVITELTAAKMRSMMQGVVLEGTGKTAALNGYSAGGKTGTAQKIDPVTHTYSHTRTVASFAGIAPVSNPAIAVAVVIDDPTVGTRYGAETSAPVFREVTQQVLEYLGVPHDQPVKTQHAGDVGRSPGVDNDADAPGETNGDLAAMFAEVNSLPEDDPLRQPATAAAMAQNEVADAAAAEKARQAAQQRPHGAMGMLPDKVLAAFHANGGTTSVMPDAAACGWAAVDCAEDCSGSADAGKWRGGRRCRAARCGAGVSGLGPA